MKKRKQEIEKYKLKPSITNTGKVKRLVVREKIKVKET